MKHTLDYILSKPTDFKQCVNCGAFNWYENEDCVTCYDEPKQFKDITKQDVQYEIDTFHSGNTDIEIDT